MPLKAPTDVTIIEEEESEFAKVRRKNWARLIAKVWLEDPSLCASCGKEMRVISALTSPHQDDVIERILKSRGAWDHYWTDGLVNGGSWAYSFTDSTFRRAAPDDRPEARYVLAVRGL